MKYSKMWKDLKNIIETSLKIQDEIPESENQNKEDRKKVLNYIKNSMELLEAEYDN